MRVLITGSSGLIGSEAVTFYDNLGADVIGLDNNFRQAFFGPGGDTTWNRNRLQDTCKHFRYLKVDVRDRAAIDHVMSSNRPDVIIHCAAQPSHDKARDIPILDFETNALGTVHMLQACRVRTPDAVFIHCSTSKVYGDAPNRWYTVEQPTRYEQVAIGEHEDIDQSTHSLFGASKLAGDIVAQEYARYFGMKVGIFRPGCLTGPWHSSVEQHGFLHYLVKCAVTGTPYKIFGYQGKQVRDNLHSYDVITAFDEFRKNPRPGEVYNLGGGRENSCSILEAVELVKEVTGRTLETEYVDRVRIGDHRCYISDLSKFRRDYPDWRVTKDLKTIIREIADRCH